MTGFFGDSIRFRSNESVVKELLALKSLEKQRKGQIIVFFIDDNFAINPRGPSPSCERSLHGKRRFRGSRRLA